MSVKNKFLRSNILCVIAVAVTITPISPTYAADSSDVIGGIFGGLLITTTLHKSQNRHINRSVQSQNNRQHDNRTSRHEHNDQDKLKKPIVLLRNFSSLPLESQLSIEGQIKD